MESIAEETAAELEALLWPLPWSDDYFATAEFEEGVDEEDESEDGGGSGEDIDEDTAAAQIVDAVAGYFRTLLREFLDDDDGDEALSRFETCRYNDDGDSVEDGEETEDDCCICLERLRRGVVATLRCRHEFHGGCIGRWLRRGQNFCPLCKARAMY
ncbi:RING-type E3 ubiquitin transferase [Salvia divinorum]|uniref:RING-type E3 ubiquitin transferase n=1 Tax=Salvia divinorum TaxID=28513 RepID=A0ABD1IEM6_SALDI